MTLEGWYLPYISSLFVSHFAKDIFEHNNRVLPPPSKGSHLCSYADKTHLALAWSLGLIGPRAVCTKRSKVKEPNKLSGPPHYCNSDLFAANPCFLSAQGASGGSLIDDHHLNLIVCSHHRGVLCMLYVVVELCHVQSLAWTCTISTETSTLHSSKAQILYRHFASPVKDGIGWQRRDWGWDWGMGR